MHGHFDFVLIIFYFMPPKAPATQLPSKGRVTINKYIHKSFFYCDQNTINLVDN
jgi:hypothetical protein